MAALSRARMRKVVQRAKDSVDSAEKGRVFEDLICYVFGKVPGIALTHRDILNTFASEELDVAFWNDKHPKGLYFLPDILLVECKNWSSRVGASEVSWFDSKLQRRSRTHGLFIAANGITGDAQQVSAAHEIVRNALSAGRHLVVITLDELLQLSDTRDLVRLVQSKLCELVVSGTVMQPAVIGAA